RRRRKQLGGVPLSARQKPSAADPMPRGSAGKTSHEDTTMDDINRSADLEQGFAARLLDVLIRAALILALAMLCYRVFSPFLVLMVWGVILALSLYPLHQAVARRIGGRQGWAATVITLFGIALIVPPAAVLLSSVGDSVQRVVSEVQQNTLQIP